MQAPVGRVAIGPNATAGARLADQNTSKGVEEVTSVEEEVNITTNVFPNPFTQEFNVQYTVESTGKVDLALYDMTGRFVASLIKQELKETGQYQKTFNANSLPAGIYVYCLEVGEKHTQGKLIKQ